MITLSKLLNIGIGVVAAVVMVVIFCVLSVADGRKSSNSSEQNNDKFTGDTTDELIYWTYVLRFVYAVLALAALVLSWIVYSFSDTFDIYKWIARSGENNYNISNPYFILKPWYYFNICCSSISLWIHRLWKQKCINVGGYILRFFNYIKREQLYQEIPIQRQDRLDSFVGDNYPSQFSNIEIRYRKILDKLASRVTFNTFQMHHRKYSQFFGRMSHTYHCCNPICQENQHKNFETFMGFALQPIIHYLVLDWVELLHGFARQSFKGNSDEEKVKFFFQLLDYTGRDKIEEDWKRLISSYNGRKNVWLTLVNFPPEVKNDTEKELLGLVFDFMCELNICNANLVVRGNNLDKERPYTSFWEIENRDNPDYSKMNFTLSLFVDDLKEYPNGASMDRHEVKKRIYFEIVEGKERYPIAIPDNDIGCNKIDEELKITVVNLDANKKYICCIRLGEKTAGKPVFRSPVLTYDSYKKPLEQKADKKKTSAKGKDAIIDINPKQQTNGASLVMKYLGHLVIQRICTKSD